MKITFRPALRADVPAIRKLHAEQQRIQGSNYEAPPFDGNCLVDAMVGESDSGEIVGCYYVEAVAELRFVAVDPRFTACARREADSLAMRLRAMGFRYLECFVPRQLKHHFNRPFRRAGFEDKDEELSYFSRDLRGEP